MGRTTADGRHIQVDVVRYATDVLTPQLRDPQKPQCCPLCVLLCVATLRNPDCDQMLSYLRLEKHDFFSACIGVLAAPRGDSDIPRLRAQLDDNHSRCVNPEWHGFVHAQTIDDPLALFITTLISCVSSAIRNVRAKGWFKAKAREGTWPTAPEQLLPFGARSSVQSYVFWCRTLLSPFAVPFLVGLLEVARSEVLPHLLAPPQKDLLMETLIATLSGKAMSSLVSADLATAGQPFGLVPQQSATHLMDTIANGQGASLVDLATLYSGHERALYPAIISALDSNLIDDEMLLLTLSSTAAHIHERLSLPQSALHERILWYKSKLDLPEGTNAAVQLVFMILFHQSRSKTCSAAGCREVGKQTCARCKTVRYCGRACQQNDWKVPQGQAFDVCVTHKALCPVLCRLNDAGVSVESRNLPRFIETYQRANIADSDCEELLTWGIVAGLVPSSVLGDLGISLLRSST